MTIASWIIIKVLQAIAREQKLYYFIIIIVSKMPYGVSDQSYLVDSNYYEVDIGPAGSRAMG